MGNSHQDSEICMDLWNHMFVKGQWKGQGAESANTHIVEQIKRTI